MLRRPVAYPVASREQIIALARAGRSPKEPPKELEPSEQTIRNWLFQDGADRGERPETLTTGERAELPRLRRENRPLNVERDIPGKRRPGSRGNRGRSRPRIRVRERESGHSPGGDDGSRVGRVRERLRRLAEARPVATSATRCHLAGRLEAPRARVAMPTIPRCSNASSQRSPPADEQADAVPSRAT